jgi:hypothetical protein
VIRRRSRLSAIGSTSLAATKLHKYKVRGQAAPPTARRQGAAVRKQEQGTGSTIGTPRQTACDFSSLACRRKRQKIKKIENPDVTYSIFARDGTSRIVLKRETREAAEKKARELTDLGWFEVQIKEEAQIEEPGSEQ